MKSHHGPENPVELTEHIKDLIKYAFIDNLNITTDFSVTREKGYYGVCYASPSKKVGSALSVDRELLIIISTFEDQQTRTIQTAKDLIEEASGRVDRTTFIVFHRDIRGNNKLKRWGREQGLNILPFYFDGEVPTGDYLLKALSHELFSYDIFDVTGPVADDFQFYGRREEARELAKKLQTGQIRSTFGIRKIGKTSILHRVVNEVREHHDCTTFLIDAQSDAIFSLNAAKLINSLALTLEKNIEYEDFSLELDLREVEIAASSERLRQAILNHDRHVLFVFDEVDYLTPTSPTAPHWRSEFNNFWRNIRSIYQSTSARKKNFSLLISGVSSKWFSEESIDGIENAALAFVPEEYLSPLPRGAAKAMIRRLGRTAGIIFSDNVSELIASNCADMPFWIRKACSFIHNKIEIGLRPFELQMDLASDYINEFVTSDGVAMSEVALAHLFRVYPELKTSAICCSEGKINEVSARMLRTLQKYGLVNRSPYPVLSGQMMTIGLNNLKSFSKSNEISDLVEHKINNDYGEWADELAIISRRRNILERKLRGVIVNFIRFSSMNNSNLGNAKDRILKCIDARRRTDLSRYDLDELINKLFWLELISILKKEWLIFEKLFGDKNSLDKYSSIVNERPDAHAKEIDLFDTALHRNAVGWFEDRLGRI